MYHYNCSWSDKAPISPTSFPGFSATRPYGVREREREKGPGWVWSRGSGRKLILREESFSLSIFCLVHITIEGVGKSKIDLLTLQL